MRCVIDDGVLPKMAQKSSITLPFARSGLGEELFGLGVYFPFSSSFGVTLPRKNEYSLRCVFVFDCGER